MKSDSKWEEARKMGRVKYSVLHGFSFAFLFSIIMLAWDVFDGKEISFVNTAILMLLNLICWGVLEYLLIWPLNERHYKKRKQSRL